jgi:hypothetical protein
MQPPLARLHARESHHRRIRRLASTVAAVLVAALCAAPLAGARDHEKAGAITPSRGTLVGAAWAQIYSLPAAENPLFGNGNPCLSVGHHVIQAFEGRQCTVEQGTALLLFLGSAWSNLEAPYPPDESAQRAVAQAADRTISEIQVTIDGGDPVDIHTARFELFSPQQTVQLPAENILGVAPQAATLTAHGWSALVRNLKPGSHTIVVEAEWDGNHIVAPHFINVVGHPAATSSRTRRSR